MSVITIRRVAAEDRDGILQLIGGIYAEHGDQLCLDGAESDLLDVQRAYGDAFIVIDRDGQIAGTHAAVPLDDRRCTFRRLYLSPDLRGGPWGLRLMQWAVEWARDAGRRRIEFWSDTRFTRAHAFFRKLGFHSDGRCRQMDDGHQPYEEYFFWRDLEGGGDVRGGRDVHGLFEPGACRWGDC